MTDDRIRVLREDIQGALKEIERQWGRIAALQASLRQIEREDAEVADEMPYDNLQGSQ